MLLIKELTDLLIILQRFFSFYIILNINVDQFMKSHTFKKYFFLVANIKNAICLKTSLPAEIGK